MIAAALIVFGWSRGAVPLPRLDRAGLTAVAATVGLVVWSGLTIWWSIAGDRSWDALGKGIVLLAVGVVGLAAGLQPAVRSAPWRCFSPGCSGPFSCGRSSARCFPALGPDDASRVARLRGSIGYWNALALVADAALGLGLWLLATVRERFARPAGAILFYLAVLVILLTQSRAGLWPASPSSLSPSGSPRAGRGCALQPSLRRPRGPRRRLGFHPVGASRRRRVPSDRVADGRLLGVMLLAGGIAALALVALVPVDRLVSTRRRAVVRGLVGAAALVLVIGIVGLVASVGNPFIWAGDQLAARRGRERLDARRQSRDKQPHGLVGRGVAGLPCPSRRRHGRAHVRDRPQARPRQRPERDRAPQPAAPAPLRLGAAGSSPSRSCSCRAGSRHPGRA